MIECKYQIFDTIQSNEIRISQPVRYSECCVFVVLLYKNRTGLGKVSTKNKKNLVEFSTKGLTPPPQLVEK